MDLGTIVSTLQESLFVIIVLVFFLAFAMIRGRQGLINLIMGLYLALLISLEFPYYDKILGGTEAAKSSSIMMIAVFTVFTILSTILFSRLMAREYDETAFESFGKKFVYALAATILVVIYSYHALPVTDLIEPGSPVATLFGSENNFFWWLLAPLIILFLI